MKEQKFIIDEVKKHLQASARKNKYQVIDAVQEMPTFEGVYTSLLRLYNGRNEIPRERGRYVYLLRRVGRVLQRDGSQGCTSHFGSRTNQRSIN